MVIQDIEAYITEANRQLGDTEFYQKEDKDLTPDHTLKVNEAITQLAAEKLIDEKTAKHLRPDNPKTPKFYMLPKVHKQNNPGRPIINSSHKQPDHQLISICGPPSTTACGETSVVY